MTPNAKGSKTPFGRELERLRNERGLKQYEVAGAVGISHQAYQHYIHGARTKISIEIIRKLAEVLHGDLETLLRLVRPDLASILDLKTEVKEDLLIKQSHLVSITLQEGRVIAEVLEALRGKEVFLENKIGFLME